MANKRPNKSNKSPERRGASIAPTGYPELLDDLKARIRNARVKAALSVNRELIQLYWSMGATIVQRQQAQGWGKSVIERLSEDLRREFPDATGLSPQNIWNMRAFYLAWTDEILAQAVRESGQKAILQQPVGEFERVPLPQPVAEIPWGHNVALVQKIKNPSQRLWYARQTVEHGWSRTVLIHQIESRLFERQGGAATNFDATVHAKVEALDAAIRKNLEGLGYGG